MPSVRFHIEGRFRKGDLSLGVVLGVIALGVDCPNVEPYLVSKALGAASLRSLIKYTSVITSTACFQAQAVHLFIMCAEAALILWR